MGHLHNYVTVSVLVLGMLGVWDLHTEWSDLHNRRVGDDADTRVMDAATRAC